MSAVAQLLDKLQSLDVKLALDGDRLTCNAPKGVLTPQLRDELAAQKELIKAFLRENTPGAKIPRVPRSGPLPVSHSQQRLWFLRQLDPSSTAYNVPVALRLSGRVDADALERAIAAVIARHESPRTRFIAVEGEPRCVIEPDVRFRLRNMDLSALSVSERDARAQERLRTVGREPFDLSRPPLVRGELIRLEPELHILCLVADHLAWDGWSIGIFVRELGVCYTAEKRGERALLPQPEVQFLDYVAWHRRWLEEEVLARQLPFWTQKLGGSLPVLELPSERPRPPVQTSNGARLVTLLPAALAQELKALAREEGVTLFMVLLAAFDVLLFRYTGQDDVVVGSVTANRPRPETEGMIGFCANNIVLRTDLSGNPSVHELLHRIRDVALSAYSHQDVPFDLLVEALRPRRELTRAPLFQALFAFQTKPEIALTGLETQLLDIDPGTARLDLAVDVIEEPQGLRVYFEYNTDLLGDAAVRRMVEHYRLLLEAFPHSRTQPIGALSLLSAAEREMMIDRWNPAPVPYSSGSLIHELIERQAQRAPAAEAVCFESRSLTYDTLNRRANQLAHNLRRRGVRPEMRIGIWLERSPQMIVALLGVLKSGAAYVPLDPAFPRERIEYMIQDAGLRLLITEERLAATLADSPSSHAVPETVRIDADWPGSIAHESEVDPPARAVPGNAAYVIYTSGSTGTPKGVVIEHRCVVNFLESMQRVPGLAAHDRLVAVTTISFDIAALEIYGPLSAGGTVILSSRATAMDAERLMALIESARATVLQATPATWRLLLEAGWSGVPGLKLLCGGEALPRDLADRLLSTRAELWNLYGPTETTIWSTVARIEAGDDFPAIGRPIANTRVYVLDDQRRPVPIGLPGELYIGGIGVAREYLGRPELTAERFVPDPFNSQPDARMYRTGDLARWRGDGSLQCLGRADQQVKVRGYRIEPAEIEAALERHADIAQAVVIARADDRGVQQLLSYVVPSREGVPDPVALRKFLRTMLPEYMIPSSFVTLDHLPLTPNGKIDRNSLPAPQSPLSVAATGTPPANDLEASVAGIWREVLKLERVGRHDNFFDLGGHSLLVVQVQSRLRTKLGRGVPLVALFQHPTVAMLAAHFTET